MADRLKRRRYPHGVYRAELLDRDNRSSSAYNEKQDWLHSIGGTVPDGRNDLERQIAKEYLVSPPIK